jgi:hypothetical protein
MQKLCDLLFQTQQQIGLAHGEDRLAWTLLRTSGP